MIPGRSGANSTFIVKSALATEKIELFAAHAIRLYEQQAHHTTLYAFLHHIQGRGLSSERLKERWEGSQKPQSY